MFNPFRLAPEDLSYKAELDEALAEDLYHRGKPAVLSFLTILYVLYLLLAEACRRNHILYLAFGAVVAAIIFRLGIVLLTSQMKAWFPDPHKRIWMYSVNTAFVGLGLAAINLFSASLINPEQFGLLAIISTGINSVAIVSMGASFPTYLLYMVPNVGSLALVLAVGPHMAYPGLCYTLIIAYILALSIMAAYVHLSLRNSILMRLRLNEMALRDSLTSLRNRRFLAEFMQLESTAILRTWNPDAVNVTPRSLGLIMLDIDHFKHVNDTYGHAAGDAVLTQVAERLVATARKPDLLIRWGGEEFVVVARETDRTPPFKLAERIRHAMESEEFLLPSGEKIRCTCSLGYSVFPFCGRRENALGWEQVLSIADVALFVAKNHGRNRTVGISLGERGEAQAEEILHLLEQDLNAAERNGLVLLTPPLLQPLPD